MKELDKKTQTVKDALKLFHDDGVIDLIAGATLINFGFDVLNQSETTSLFTWVPILLISSLKNKTTLPRLGKAFVDANETHIRKWTFFPAAGMILVLVVLGIFVLSDPIKVKEMAVLPIPGNLHNLLSSFLLALSLLIPAFWVPLKRFFIYSGVAFAAGLASYFILPIYVSVFLTAAVMTGLGIRLMIKFSKEHPLQKEKPVDEN